MAGAEPIRVRNKRKPVAEINVVPYIDVMLVLLVVFMITAPMLTQGVQVELPKVDAKPISIKNEEPLILSVRKDGQYLVNLGDNNHTLKTQSQVVEQVKKILKQKPDTLVLLEGDKDVGYGKVVALLAALQGEGLENVGLITDPPEVR